MKLPVIATALVALTVLSVSGVSASRFHVMHHMRNGAHRMHMAGHRAGHYTRVKMHHGHMHMHNMMYHGHM